MNNVQHFFFIPKSLSEKYLGERIRTSDLLHPMQVFQCFNQYKLTSININMKTVNRSLILIYIKSLSYDVASNYNQD